MSQSEHLCKAILEQGINKGKQCSRPMLLNNYCGKHQTQSELNSAHRTGERKCSRIRCTNTFVTVSGKKLEYCAECMKLKEESLETLTLCKWQDAECKHKARESGFCGKHEPRALLLKEASAKGVRICDDAKRACKNETVDNKLKCEQCLEKNRTRENAQYSERIDNSSLCLGCGKDIEKFIIGKRDNLVQRCEECYIKLRKTEDERGERERNYSAEKRENLDRYFLTYIKCAKIRNIGFELSKEDFETLVLQSCYYCGESKEGEVIGVDRLDSLMKYTIINCVPCCKTCNFMKGTLSKTTFIAQAHKIADHISVESIKEEIKQEVELSSMIPPAKVAEMYKNGKFDDYIEACVRDKRSPLFIERLRNVDRGKLTYSEFKTFFRTCCKNDSKLTNNSEHDIRQRIGSKEIYGYFNNKNHEYFIELYSGIHGEMGGFREDLNAIANEWKNLSYSERNARIKSVIVKYRNQRAQNRVKCVISSS